MSQKEKELKKNRDEGPEPGEGSPAGAGAVSERAQKAAEEADDLLDKIDEVLEKNASSFVKSFVQKGGE